MRIWADKETGMIYRAVAGKEMLERKSIWDDDDIWEPSKILKLRHAETIADSGLWVELGQ